MAFLLLQPMANEPLMKKILMLIPCYNEEARLDAFLASIKRQTIPVEVVAVDDGSTDNTFAKLSESHLLSATRNPGNIGITRSMNRLFEIARSFSPDYLTWCGVDEELYPDGIERRLRYLEANDTEIVITGGDVVTGHDPATGRELWRAGGLNPSNEGDYRIVASSVVYGDVIYASSRERPLLALKAGGRG